MKHESHPMNHDFKVEFNYSWLAPPVDDYLKVVPSNIIFMSFPSSLALDRRNGMRSSRLLWRGKVCRKLRASGENQTI